MKDYLIKKLIGGYKIKSSLKNKTLIATPYQYDGDTITVKYGKERMIINKNTEQLHHQSFPDKFGRNKEYTLYYYEWKPYDNQQKLEL